MKLLDRMVGPNWFMFWTAALLTSLLWHPFYGAWGGVWVLGGGLSAYMVGTNVAGWRDDRRDRKRCYEDLAWMHRQQKPSTGDRP